MLPDKYTRKLFDRFVSMWGAQKVGAMWDGANLDEVRSVWGRALGPYELETIGKAVDAIQRSGREWPPTLPEFLAVMRQFNAPQSLEALPPPEQLVDRVQARENIVRIQEMLRKVVKRIDDPAEVAPPPIRIEDGACTCQGVGSCSVCVSFSERSGRR